MILAAEQVAFPGGAARAAVAIDLRSRRLKSVLTDDAWLTGELRLRELPPVTIGSLSPTYDQAGVEKLISGAEAETFYVLDPNDLEGMAWLMVTSDIAQGTPAGFAVIPNTTNFSVGPPVTFTTTVVDPSEFGGTFTSNVSLSANYADVDALVAALALKAPDLSWSNNAGAVTAEYSGGLNSYVDVTNIVDGSDKMNFSSIIDFAFPGYATDAYVTLITEPRT